MDYNTSRKSMALPEYGRNIQKMVDYIKTVEDRDERNRLANAIIGIMGNKNPHLRDVTDFKHKLWDHLAIISDFDLDVDSPYPTPDKEILYEKPQRLPYKKPEDIRFKHYGRLIANMIERATEYEDGEEKDYLIEVIANHMKKSYIMWNRDNISDDLIFSDLIQLSGDKITIPEELKLKDTKDLQNYLAKKQNQSNSKKNQQHKNNNRNQGKNGYAKKRK